MYTTCNLNTFFYIYYVISVKNAPIQSEKRSKISVNAVDTDP